MQVRGLRCDSWPSQGRVLGVAFDETGPVIASNLDSHFVQKVRLTVGVPVSALWLELRRRAYLVSTVQHVIKKTSGGGGDSLF